MRKLMILLAMIVGFMGQKELGTELEFTYPEDEPATTIAYEQQQVDEVGYMTHNELMKFDAMIYDLYITEYCTNLCEECDTYYYKDCMCNACSTDCEECLSYDYELYFITDYYDMIMDEYEEVLRGIIDSRNNPKVEVKICEF